MASGYYTTGAVVAPPPVPVAQYVYENGGGGGTTSNGVGGGTFYANQDLAGSGKILFAEAMSAEYYPAVPVSAPPPPPLQQQEARPQPQNALQAQFMRYDDLNAILQALGDASGARVNGERNLDAAQRTYNENEKLLQKNRASQPRAERRLHRNAHPRFLHYFQFNREAKVKRLEKELEELRADERRRDELKRQYAQDIEQRRRELATLQASEAQMKQAQREKQQIFDNVVDTQPPTPNLANLRFQLTQAEADYNTDSNLLRAVEISLSRIEGARQLFQAASQQIRQATSMNMGAGFVNMGQAWSNDRQWGADEAMERAMQFQRDNLLNQARETALRAADQLQSAFDSFPMEARVRYPQLTLNICNAPIPNLRGANFFGTVAVGWAFGGMGDMMNDMYAQQKLHNNMRVLSECEQIAAGQAAAVRAIVTQIGANVRSIEAECSSLKASIQSERKFIFDSTRHAAFSSGSGVTTSGLTNSDFRRRQ